MITVGLTYYNSRDHWEWNKFYYANANTDGLKFIVVDDGSQDDPLTVEDMPDGWDLYQVTEDVGWNNEGAKNLIMKVTETEWTLLLDIDYVLMPHAIESIKQLHKADKDKAYFARRHVIVEPDGYIKPFVKVSPNSYAITKDLFWQLGGYDESLQGLYGYDGTMVKRLTPGHPELRHQWGIDCIALGGGGSSWTREEKDASKVICKQAGRERGWSDPRRIKFPWKKLT